jgi:hypothetical protein
LKKLQMTSQALIARDGGPVSRRTHLLVASPWRGVDSGSSSRNGDVLENNTPQ